MFIPAKQALAPLAQDFQKKKNEGKPGGRGREQEDRTPREMPFTEQQLPLGSQIHPSLCPTPCPWTLFLIQELP